MVGFFFITIPKCSQGDFALCPVRAAAQFLSVLRLHCLSFFSHFNGDLVTRSQFTAVLQRSLDFVGLRDMRFSSHSFHIGAATSRQCQVFLRRLFKLWGVGSPMPIDATFELTLGLFGRRPVYPDF